MFANVSHFGNPDWIVAYGNHYRGLHTFRRGRFFGLPYQVRGRDSCPYTLTSYPEILELVRNIPDHPESFERPAAVGQFSIRIHGVNIRHRPDRLTSTAPEQLCLDIEGIAEIVNLRNVHERFFRSTNL